MQVTVSAFNYIHRITSPSQKKKKAFFFLQQNAINISWELNRSQGSEINPHLERSHRTLGESCSLRMEKPPNKAGFLGDGKSSSLFS